MLAMGLGALGLRGPSLAEAEAADAECCRQLSALMARGHSLDQALHEVVEVRNSLHMWLQPRPRFAPLKPSNQGKGGAAAPYGQAPWKQHKKGSGKGKGKRGEALWNVPWISSREMQFWKSMQIFA